MDGMNRGSNIEYMSRKFDLKQFKDFYKTIGGIIIAMILLSIIINMFFFQVDEREQAVVKQFNEYVKIIVNERTDELVKSIEENPRLKGLKVSDRKGLHFKIPFIQTIEKFTSMFLIYDTDAREVVTKDKKKLVLDNYAIWKISNPALFYSSLGNERAAHTRLDDIIYSKLNEQIGRVESHTVISDKSFIENMLTQIKEDSNQQVMDYGMEVIDIRIKRTDFPEENYENIYNRMNTERQRAAKTYRSEGLEEAQKIRSEADKESTIIVARSYEEAEKTKGEGDAEALRIYAEAYNQDPEFYAFWRSLQAYKKTLKNDTKIIIDADSEFAKYLFGTK